MVFCYNSLKTKTVNHPYSCNMKERNERLHFDIMFSISCNTGGCHEKIIIFFSILIMYILHLPELYRFNQLADRRECLLPWPEELHYHGSVAILQRALFLICYSKYPSSLPVKRSEL